MIGELNNFGVPHPTKQIFCTNCRTFQPMVEEPMRKDDLNEYPWGDLLCGKCGLVVTTIREVAKKS